MPSKGCCLLASVANVIKMIAWCQLFVTNNINIITSRLRGVSHLLTLHTSHLAGFISVTSEVNW